jgi:type IV pilus assembly protein PilB
MPPTLSPEAATALNDRLRAALAARGMDCAALAPGEGELIGDMLIGQGRAHPAAVNEALQEVTGVASMDPSLMSFEADFTRRVAMLLPREEALAYRVMPIRLESGEAHVVMAVPGDAAARTALESRLGARLVPYVCHGKGVLDKIAEVYARPLGLQDELSPDMAEQAHRAFAALSRALAEVGAVHDPAEEPHVVALLRLVLGESAELGSSDIHFEPASSGLRIRNRQDGILQVALTAPALLGKALTRRLKLLSGMDAKTTDAPQDGAIAARIIPGRDMDIRVSALPTLHGEKIVLRLLDKGKTALGLGDLHLSGRDAEVLARAVSSPNGLILVTGPTGSGKTTTLYAILGHLNTTKINIVTAEDPVEYRLDGVSQVQCHGETGLTFEQVLRSFLRQDPDVIMVGEIRDPETADFAVKSAMTGHLVLSSLHTNDAPSAIPRLVNMGVPVYLAAAARVTVIAQRLVRRICPDCKREAAVPETIPLHLGEVQDVVWREGAGCPACRNTGYRGRLGVFEMFSVTEDIERLILAGESAAAIRRAAKARGMRTLPEAALDLARLGETTIEEVLRTTGDLAEG